ncbi:MAG: ABC transporter ATP-binding protein [Pseudolabrys sp.]|nr:ABC transporter ATP-binding protein [Pseudolabrys sp.]MDP2295400.1 ABC transporter ATP-binding protein [Pseudolabrys sp.]
MTHLVLDKVHKRYGEAVAVREVSLQLTDGEFVTLLGPSGCGKTTCLRMVAGFVKPDAGTITIDGVDITNKPPYERDMGMVFQSYALFPHKTVAANVAFGLKIRRVSTAESDQRTKEALNLVQLEHLADRYPSQLSGGQRQRVALARAVVIRPKVLLLDEPLGALDLKLREELQIEIKRVQSTLGITTLFVTHDQGEALGLSDRIAVMRDGNIIQIDTPTKIYERPNSTYAANFVGRTNLAQVMVRKADPQAGYLVEMVDQPGVTFEVAGDQPQQFLVGERCSLAARPEHFDIGSTDGNTVEAVVTDVNYRGSIWNVELLAKGNWPVSAQVRPGGRVPTKSETVSLGWHPSRSFLLKLSDDEKI